ncbi:MAG TPA: DUF2905 domain-containing protein [Candidatus Deferrimicrobiaceae bacterium]|jgi:hypothetical protein|nr:DUF2905 domain-containing protein [Candidatus Deferrimicrobiaceae bacterium]
MTSLGKILLVSGLLLAGAGLLVLLADRIGWLGKLPGDIIVKRENFTFYFPLATCILISIVLSLLFWLFRK